MKISIRWVLVFAFTLVILISIGFVITSSYISSKNALLAHAQSVMRNIITFTMDKSKNHILVAKDATELTQGLTSSSVVNSEDFRGMEKYFFEQLKINRQFANVYYGNKNGDFIMVSRDTKNVDKFNIKTILNTDGVRTVTLRSVNSKFIFIDEKPLLNDNYDPRERPWYKAAKKEKKTIWTDPYIFFQSKSLGITAASPVVNAAQEIIGSVGVDIALKELSVFLSKLDFNSVGKVFIFDKKMNIIAADDSILPKSNKIKLTKVNEIKDDILNKSIDTLLEKSSLENINKKMFFTFKNKDEEYHAIFSPFEINNIKWIIGIYVAEDAYLGDIKDNQITNIYIASFIALLFLYVSYLISNSIAKPISQMQEMAQELKNHNFNIPRIPPSSFSEIKDSVEAFNEMKEELIEYKKETTQLNKNLKNAYLDTLHRLALASEYKDSDTSAHIHRIAIYSEIIAKEMGMSDEEVYIIKNASMMHDVGKLGIPDNILLKPARLTKEEMEIMKTHSLLGAEILKDANSKILKAAHKIAMYHHEKWDGSGYPCGKKGNDIPLIARIVTVVDVFDALITKRCYKEAYNMQKTLDILHEGKGKHFDPKCINAFDRAFNKIAKTHDEYKDGVL